MLRTVNDQATLWESILPAAVLGMPAELEAVDRLLDDPRFFEPYRAVLPRDVGRPSVPIETYLRLMFLKYRYRLGFEPLCREVADSITWQRFCRIPLGGVTPHPTTLMKITTRCGERRDRRVERRVVGQGGRGAGAQDEPGAGGHHGDRSERRVSGRFVAVGQGCRRGSPSWPRRAHAQGLAVRTPLRDRTRSVYRRARDVVNTLRQRDDERPRPGPWRLNAELAQIAQRSIREAQAVIRNARRRVRQLGERATGRQRAIINDLVTLSERLERVAAQTRQRVVEGVTPPGATRVVSLHDPDARPIAKGRLGRPVEFGYKAQIVDNEDGVILDHNVELGNPPDAPMLVPAIERITRRTGTRSPRRDRGPRLRRSVRRGHVTRPWRAPCRVAT